MSTPFRYVQELETVQDGLGQAITAIEKRLTGSRMARLAPIPRVDLGYHGVRTVRPIPQIKRSPMPELPKPPADLKEAVLKAVNDFEPETVVTPTAKTTKPEEQNDQKSESSVEADMTKLYSLIHEKVVVGNRRSIDFIAGVRLRLAVEGAFGIKTLFPQFVPGASMSFEVEATLHRVGAIDSPDEGLDIGPLVPAMLQSDWPFRAFPWTSQIKRDLGIGLKLPASFTNVKANEEMLGAGGHLFGDDVFLIIALDSQSGEQAPALKEALTAREDAQSQKTVDADQIIEKDRSTQDTQSTPLDRSTPSSQFERAYAAFLESTEEERDFPSFIQRLKVFENELPESVELWSPEFFDEFEQWCHRDAALYGEAAETTEDTDLVTQPLNKVAPVDESTKLRPIFDRRQLVRKFKHAGDFGVLDNFGPASLERFAQTLEHHIAEASGRYVANLGGASLVAHVGLGRIVWTTNEGEFVTCYKASAKQLKLIWSKPVWRRDSCPAA
ncbi:MAG: hypothetical protein GY854_32420 [Deltaproteobacteria bacterium]|nr:hypothetical protein [Deltaproteobacteria bacterium]